MDAGQILQVQNGAPVMAAPPMVLAQPINDVQMVALIASHLPGTPQETVAQAVEIVAQACIQAGGNKLGKKIKELSE